ncbi:MAG: ABC transporter ATP-binding protein [Treponema sp.]|jgi:ABC-type dipeptide/oligopeptide/nickel transport system ATPase component|nr:ABC transporter ATP-binding protein [Treponema sp.]
MLKVAHLTVRFPHPQGDRIPLRDWNLDIEPGEILGLVGNSGCGKTVCCSALLGILEPPGYVEQGSMYFTAPGETTIDLRALTEAEWRHIRGRKISMIFQDPLSALSPSHKVKTQCFAALRAHDAKTPQKVFLEQAEDLLAKMGFLDPRRIMDSYPFELSGGMAQRVLIAMALIHRPALLIADEPTTALDVKTESHIIQLFSQIRKEFGMAILLVSHDEKILRKLADRSILMP